ncbi:hypothetical protein [Iningainema tapete]|uniref:Uncharacterized protein n=1 Tax=Iningainema tapete BLCC-T55 TaxID=2748662 RepID=A0A8J6XIU5_9CYAN|nr:hypothetical protein [Iningainema tapete]MBD2771531.1 hypothetical protein [Iningainema tapete BLCC-T55]
MNQSNQKAKKAYTTPEITLLGVLLPPSEDFTIIETQTPTNTKLDSNQ